MLTLYHCVSARSFRPLWMLEELRLPYRLAMLPFPPRVQARSYLDVNPLGTVPLLVDRHAQMSESVAICQYLCAKYGPTELQVTPEEEDYAAYLNYLHFGEATLTFPQTLVLRYSRFEPEHRQLPAVAEDYKKWFLARLRTLETRLATQPFVSSQRFTAADVSVGYALMLAERIGLASQFPPAIAAYWERLKNRDAFKRALNAEREAAIAQGVPATSAVDFDGTR